MQIKFFKRKKSFKKGGLGTNPEFFWDILLFLALAIIILSFIFGFILFRKINRDAISAVDSISEKSQTINKERIDKVLQYFSDREKKSIEILNSSAPVVDPSL